MPRRIKVGARGLMTDPNPLELPPGALRQATNVVIRRHGTIEPRPGMEDITAASAPSTKIERVIPYRGVHMLVCRTGAGAWTYRQDDWTEVKDEDAASIGFDDPGKVQYAEAAGNLYVTCDDGVRRISSDTDTTAYRAGLPAAAAGVRNSLAGAGTWMAAGEIVAYRYVITRTVNGRVLRSAPSGRWYAENTTTSATSPDSVMALPDGTLEGDVLEIYRSSAVTTDIADVPDDMRLVYTYRVTASDVSAGTTGAIDDVTDHDERGVPLYTNETQQGALQANDRPPKADDVCLYQTMMLYAGTQQPHRVLLEVLPVTSPSERITRHSFTGNFASASPTISNVSSFAGIEVGMYITDRAAGPGSAGTNVPANTTITAFDSGAGTITMSNNALATNTGVTTYGVDFIKVGSEVYWAGEGISATEQTFLEQGSGDPNSLLSGIAYAINITSSSYYALVPSNVGHGGSLLLESRVIPGTQFAVTASKGARYSPEIGVSGTDVQSESEDRPNRIYYSKLDQPEAVPGTNYLDVGHERSAIQRIAVIRDAALVFTTDGVYRLSGRTPESLRLDPAHRDTRLVHRNALAVSGDRVFAWTSNGIVAFGDGTAVPLSDTALEADLETIQSHGLQLSTDIDTEPDLSGRVIAVDPHIGEVYVLVPSAIGNDYARVVYVYNIKTGSWATWDTPAPSNNWLGARDVVFDPVANATQFAGSEINANTPELWQVRRSRYYPGELLYYDASSTISISSVVGDTITIIGDTEIGAAFTKGSVTGVILTNPKAGEYTFAADGTVTTGSATFYTFVDCAVEWVLDDAEDPGTDKFWKTFALAFSGLQYLGIVKMTFRSNSDGTGTELSQSPGIAESSSILSRFFRWLVHRDAARSPTLYAKMVIRQALGAWRLQACTTEYDPMDERIDR